MAHENDDWEFLSTNGPQKRGRDDAWQAQDDDVEECIARVRSIMREYPSLSLKEEGDGRWTITAPSSLPFGESEAASLLVPLVETDVLSKYRESAAKWPFRDIPVSVDLLYNKLFREAKPCFTAESIPNSATVDEWRKETHNELREFSFVTPSRDKMDQPLVTFGTTYDISPTGAELQYWHRLNTLHGLTLVKLSSSEELQRIEANLETGLRKTSRAADTAGSSLAIRSRDSGPH